MGKNYQIINDIFKLHKIKLKKTGKVKVDDITCMLGNVNDVASCFGDTVLKNTQARMIAEDTIKHAENESPIEKNTDESQKRRLHRLEGGRCRSIKYEDHVNDIANHNLVSNFIDGSLDRFRKN